MFLKNNSEYQVTLLTRKGNVVINPGKTVHILERDIIKLNSLLTVLDENETNEKTVVAPEGNDLKGDANEPKADDENETNEKTVVAPEGNDLKGDANEPKADDENETDDESKDTKKVDDEKSDKTELEVLEEKLEKLKSAWENVKRPNKKAEIQEQIKQVQEEIAKLK